MTKPDALTHDAIVKWLDAEWTEWYNATKDRWAWEDDEGFHPYLARHIVEWLLEGDAPRPPEVNPS